MKTEEFRKYAHELVDWMADYLEQVENYPVSPDIQPGDIFRQLPENAPQAAESFEAIFRDFKEIIVPGMTHWESPNFMAYFPANKSKASILAEMLTSTMGAQCMIWLTSPAAAELEERVMIWLRDILGLSADYTGVIQDTASTATLCALLTAREKYSNFSINEKGFQGNEKFVVYASDQVHSSIDKAIKIAGLGAMNLRKIEVDANFAMVPEALQKAIEADIQIGNQPLCVISAMGTTSSTAVDPIDAISDICLKYEIWHHVDAAYAGTALCLPEMRWMSKGVDKADSFVVNPHKWMFTNFDCTAYFVKDPQMLVNTFAISPEYLKTNVDAEVKNYRDWGVQLGRRFRALKLWFVIREMGVDGIQSRIRKHIGIGQWLKKQIEVHTHFELLAPVPLNTLCFRFNPGGQTVETLNSMNREIMDSINKSGKFLFTHTELNGNFALRIAAGNTNLEQHHVENLWNLIQSTAKHYKVKDN